MKRILADHFEKISNLNFRAKRKNSSQALPFYENVPILRKDMPKDMAFSLNEFQGFLADRTFLRAEKGQEKRRCLASVLFSELESSAIAALPASLSELKENGFWHFPIYVEDKLKFGEYLFSRGIDVVGSTLQLCSQIDEFSRYSTKVDGAKFLYEHNIFLPMHDDYTADDMKKIARAVNEFFHNSPT